jgi:hypothetical protein
LVSNNNNEDRARILREARATLDRRVEPYVFKALPRAYLDDPPEPEPFEPAPARSARLDTAPEQRSAPTATDWSAWEAWVAARIEAALIEERQAIAEIMSEALGHCLAREREDAAEAMRGLRDDLRRAEAALQQLQKLVEIERAKVVDLPALPARRDFN